MADAQNAACPDEAELRRYLADVLTLDESCACAETRARAARKLALIEQKMADLVVMQQLLGELVQQCDAGDGGTICPIIEALIRE